MDQLQEQMDECEIVQAAYPGSSLCDHGIFELFVQDSGADELHVITKPVTLQIPLKNGALLLAFDIPRGYPMEVLRVSILSSRDLSREEEDTLNSTFRETASTAASRSDPSVFDILQGAEAFLDASALATTEKAVVSPQTTSAPIIIGRRLIYSHHIIATQKRAAVRDNAAELRLSGFVKHGWPGVIVVEGAEDDAEEYVRRLKRFKWQHLEVRGEETVNASSFEAGIMEATVSAQETPRITMDTLRRLPLGFYELGDGPRALGDAGDRCREAGLGPLFDTLFIGCRGSS
mmetsp:Transcript_58298/g.117115  ORF Transcript_58298/g.117115 Transcript_58298/m.117115 type:complete len:290 (-) Transcript_58298:139-1008(-)